MQLFFALLQDVDIEEKIQNAPDKGYEIGVFIGSMLPFVVLVLLAYIIYKYNNMDIMSFLSGNGLFLILGIVLIVVYFYNKRKKR